MPFPLGKNFLWPGNTEPFNRLLLSRGLPEIIWYDWDYPVRLCHQQQATATGKVNSWPTKNPNGGGPTDRTR